MKIAVFQFEVSGDLLSNYYEMKQAIMAASEAQAELIIFPECCLTGYPPRNIQNADAVEFNQVEQICSKIQSLSDQTRIAVLFGTIYRQQGKIYNRTICCLPEQASVTYDKRALWGWDRENFSEGTRDGIFELNGIRIGIRICYEVRFPEYFRELFNTKTDINIVLFNDVSDQDDIERYQMIMGHLQTRAVENVTTTISVNNISPYQTAPTVVIGKSGQIISESERNQKGLMFYDFRKTEDQFGEQGRREISERLDCVHYIMK